MRHIAKVLAALAVAASILGAAPASAKHRRRHHPARRVRVVRVYRVPRRRVYAGSFARAYNRDYRRRARVYRTVLPAGQLWRRSRAEWANARLRRDALVQARSRAERAHARTRRHHKH